jgi:hypothetical protein
MQLDDLDQLARYTAILRKAAAGYPPGKVATRCCFISTMNKCACLLIICQQPPCGRLCMQTRITSGWAVAGSLSNVRIAWTLSNLGRVAAGKHPLSRKPAHHSTARLISQFPPSARPMAGRQRRRVRTRPRADRNATITFPWRSCFTSFDTRRTLWNPKSCQMVLTPSKLESTQPECAKRVRNGRPDLQFQEPSWQSW